MLSDEESAPNIVRIDPVLAIQPGTLTAGHSFLGSINPIGAAGSCSQPVATKINFPAEFNVVFCRAVLVGRGPGAFAAVLRAILAMNPVQRIRQGDDPAVALSLENDRNELIGGRQGYRLITSFLLAMFPS